MAATREDLRDHLRAVIEAAQELPREDRTYLADTFLDELEKQYQLVPRTGPGQRAEVHSARRKPIGIPLGPWPAPVGLLFLLPLLLPVLFFSLLFLVHPPVLLLALVLFLIFRFGRPGMGRRGWWQYGR